MKFFTSQLAFFLKTAPTRRNIRLLSRFIGSLTALVVAYSVLFHVLMVYEGQQHSWVTGFYWTLTVMSTLGFGDITFKSDLGRIFSMIVLLSGMVSLLMLLPFTFIEFFYAPWMRAQSEARAAAAFRCGPLDEYARRGATLLTARRTSARSSGTDSGERAAATMTASVTTGIHSGCPVRSTLPAPPGEDRSMGWRLNTLCTSSTWAGSSCATASFSTRPSSVSMSTEHQSASWGTTSRVRLSSVVE